MLPVYKEIQRHFQGTSSIGAYCAPLNNPNPTPLPPWKMGRSKVQSATVQEINICSAWDPSYSAAEWLRGLGMFLGLRVEGLGFKVCGDFQSI